MDKLKQLLSIIRIDHKNVLELRFKSAMKLIILLSIEEDETELVESLVKVCIKEYGQDEVFNTIDNLLSLEGGLDSDLD
jgi:hypothetical protein